MDRRFAFDEASRELVVDREWARNRGIGPLDQEYPSLEDYMPELNRPFYMEERRKRPFWK